MVLGLAPAQKDEFNGKRASEVSLEELQGCPGRRCRRWMCTDNTCHTVVKKSIRTLVDILFYIHASLLKFISAHEIVFDVLSGSRRA